MIALFDKNRRNFFSFSFRSRFPENPPVTFSIPDWQLQPEKDKAAEPINGDSNGDTNGTEAKTNGLENANDVNKQEQTTDPDLVSNID